MYSCRPLRRVCAKQKAREVRALKLCSVQKFQNFIEHILLYVRFRFACIHDHAPRKTIGGLEKSSAHCLVKRKLPFIEPRRRSGAMATAHCLFGIDIKQDIQIGNAPGRRNAIKVVEKFLQVEPSVAVQLIRDR